MTDKEPDVNPNETLLAQDPARKVPNSAPLADDDEAQDERGRIGYGRNERKSSWMLGLSLVLVIAALGVYSVVSKDDEEPGNSQEIAHQGGPAPDFEMTTFDGETFRLSEHRGEVVIVNFWKNPVTTSRSSGWAPSAIRKTRRGPSPMSLG
jgi:hypothetical protein